METKTIADVYETNKNIHDQLAVIVAGLSEHEATALPDGEKWSIQQIVEHVSIVDDGMSKICAKLLGEAKIAGNPGTDVAQLSPEFGQKAGQISTMKVEAPERVHPTGDVPIEESLKRMAVSADAFASMKSDFESYDLTQHKFPHPFFGNITATEWLVLLGGHKMRHAKQIQKLVEKIRA